MTSNPYQCKDCGDEFRRVNALIQHQNNSSWCPGAIDRHNGRRQQRQQLNQNPINPSEYVCQQVYNPPVLPSEIEFQSDEPKSSLQEAPHTREKRKWSSSLAAAACRSSKRRRSVRSPVPVPEPPPPIAARDVDDVNFDPELTDFAGEMERLKLGQPFPPNLLIECNSTCPPLENSSLAVHAPLPLPNASNRKDYPRTTTTTIMGCKLNSEIGKVYNFPMEEQQRQFSNQFLPADKVLAKIHFECYQAGSPLYLPDRIIGILQEANWTYAGFHLGSPYITKRESLLKRIEKTVGASPPTVLDVNLESGLRTRIHRFDFQARLQDHLMSNVFADYGNLSIRTPQDKDVSPFINTMDGALEEPPTIPDFVSGEWYKKALEMYKLDLDSGDYLLHPLVAYMDKTGIDRIEKNGLEPFAVTSANLSQGSREIAENWILLGYVPSLKWLKHQHSPTTTTNKRSLALRDYHHCLSLLLEPLKTLQTHRPQMLFRRGAFCGSFRIIPPLASMIGDNLSNDMLAQRVADQSETSPRMSRRCLCPAVEADKPLHKCIPLIAQFVDKLSQGSLGPSYGRQYYSFVAQASQFQNVIPESPNFEGWRKYVDSHAAKKDRTLLVWTKQCYYLRGGI
ncbi:unnamed protein product [Cylindrotheca closterium]|uniref:C2H2-type domain-containing protein n=1 Tax=Cylindrotheca closterium TaxID=2856 RepID=A0AAD2JI30_9STRA|nr:unnamed protein product [Cylindrotheca closterium]